MKSVPLTPNTKLVLILCLAIGALFLNAFVSYHFSEKVLDNLKLQEQVKQIDSDLSYAGTLTNSYIQHGDDATWHEITALLQRLDTNLDRLAVGGSRWQRQLGQLNRSVEEYHCSLDELHASVLLLEEQKVAVRTVGLELSDLVQTQLIDPLNHEAGLAVFRGDSGLHPFKSKAKDIAHRILNLHTQQRLLLFDLMLSADMDAYHRKRAPLATGLSNSSVQIGYVSALLGSDFMVTEAIESIDDLITHLNEHEQSLVMIFAGLLDLQLKQGQMAASLKRASHAFVALISAENRATNRSSRWMTWSVLGVSTLLLGGLALMLARQVMNYVKGLEQAHSNLRVSESKLKTIVESIADGLLVTDRDANIVRMNPEALRLTGVAPGTTEQRKLGDVVALSLDGQELGTADLLTLVEQPYRLLGTTERLVLIAADGREIPIALSGAAISSEGDVLSGYVFLLRDVSAEKKLNQQLRQAQKMEAIGTLAGGIAHDFNNILASIFGFAELSIKHAEGHDKLSRNLKQILQAGERARGLVQHLLSFSRSSGVEKKVVAIDSLLRESIDFIDAAASAAIEIRTDFKHLKLKTMANPTQLHQVFMNILTNAVQAMEEQGGILSVDLDRIAVNASDELQLGRLAPGAYARIRISDSGCGIAAEYLEQIFNPFFTTKAKGKGTGLGLSVAYGILEDMGGHISVYSEPGQGTSFSIFLPEVVAQSIEPLALRDLVEGSGTILLVDDETAIIAWTEELLGLLGYRVIGVSDPEEAVEIFYQRSDEIDLVITDFEMPAMTGLALAETLHNHNPEVVILLCTGFRPELDDAALRRLGIAEVLMKPVTAGELSHTLTVHLSHG